MHAYNCTCKSTAHWHVTNRTHLGSGNRTHCQDFQNALSLAIVFFSLLLLPNFVNGGLSSFSLPPPLCIPFPPGNPHAQPGEATLSTYSVRSSRRLSYCTPQSSACVSIPLDLPSVWERLFLTCLCTRNAWHLVGAQLAFDTWVNVCGNTQRDPLTAM